MTKRKKSQNAASNSSGQGNESSNHVSEAASTSTSSPSAVKPNSPSNATGAQDKLKPAEPPVSALIICRNKHWRYISSFHGPWLQLPPEILESLAYSNYTSPRPRPIDPGVFFDLVKIRRLVEEATTLAVRAANGATASTLSNSLNAGHGLLNGGGAAALGLGIGGGGANAKLSRERKHRMRELATQKLSRAYHLDEIAASVATMQSASSLEEVAKLVLQRNPNDVDAKYVHFFHEKIPSRMLAQCTTLQPLDDIVQERPTDGALFRTRAVTRIFKDDFAGAARDLTEGLAVARYTTAEHKGNKAQLELANGMKGMEVGRWNSTPIDDSRNGLKLDEEDQPGGLEPQLLFQRAGVYLTIAYRHVGAALTGIKQADNIEAGEASLSCDQNAAQQLRLEARKIVKTNAKRALRDYLNFLSNLDYTSGLPHEVTEEFFRKVNAAANGSANRSNVPTNRLLEMSGNSSLSNGSLSDALIPRKDADRSSYSDKGSQSSSSFPSLPLPEVHQLSTLFSSTPPSTLLPYPAPSLALVPSKPSSTPFPTISSHEAITYHPLLTDALHSLLLAHSLMQTSPKELLRHAHMVARLVRVADGYPVFLASRSPARADWIDVLRRTANWLGIQQSWETLCAPAPLPARHGEQKKKEETEEERRERRKHEAVMEALADERVVDEATFRVAVEARERRDEEEELQQSAGGGAGAAGPKRWTQSGGAEYPICTERAEAVARWVMEAPGSVEGEGRAKRGGKKGKGKRAEKSTAGSDGGDGAGAGAGAGATIVGEDNGTRTGTENAPDDEAERVD